MDGSCMTLLTLTSKRQATFPKATCQTLGLKPGDVIALEPRTEAGEKVWVLRPQPTRPRPWLGCLGVRAKNVSDHSLAAVRASIAAGRSGRA